MNNINCFWTIKKLKLFDLYEQKLILNKMNKILDLLSAKDRIRWAINHLPAQLILTSSFGIQSSVSLHLITSCYPNVPVILIDTGYLFPETYCFIDRLTEKMKLNLHVFRANHSAAWQEARYGKLWEQGLSGIDKYNVINKVEPMKQALKALQVNTWFAGLRRSQSNSRKYFPIVSIQNDIFKFLPIVDWNNEQVYKYINEFKLELHPLQKAGYVSVGDIHTTKKLDIGMKEEDTRFFGLKRECGLHEFD